QDRITSPVVIKDLRADYALNISAKSGLGLDELNDTISKALRETRVHISKRFSYEEAGKINLIRKYGQLIKEEYHEDGIYIEAFVPAQFAN
ncbi:MAG: GTPase HflX, partial [Eubacterium sp.]